jgi:hypothetical protein
MYNTGGKKLFLQKSKRLSIDISTTFITTHDRWIDSGANSTIVSYNASVVKIYYNAMSNLRFENKNIFSYFEKRISLLQTTLAL